MRPSLLLLRPIPIYTLVKRGRARARISTWAIVIGSKEPGKRAIRSSVVVCCMIFKKTECRLPVLAFFPEARQITGFYHGVRLDKIGRASCRKSVCQYV